MYAILSKIPTPDSTKNADNLFANYEIMALSKLPRFLLSLDQFKQRGDEILVEKLALAQSLQSSLGNLFEAFKTLQHTVVEPILKRMSLQVEKIGVADIRHHYLVISATYVSRCNRFDLMPPITKELRRNSTQFLIDEGLIIADYYEGQYYEQIFDFGMAQKSYLRMLLVALNMQDISFELKAYDQLSKVYYYLQDLQKSHLLHRKFMEGDTEPLDSRFRSKGIRNLLYTEDVSQMKEFMIETYLREEELHTGQIPKLDQASKVFKAGLRRIIAEQDRNTRLYKVLTRQHRNDSENKSQLGEMKARKEVLSDPNKMYVTHLSYARSISKLDIFKKIKASSKIPKSQFAGINIPQYWSFDEASFDIADTIEGSRMLETDRSGDNNEFSKFKSIMKPSMNSSGEENTGSNSKRYGSPSNQAESGAKKSQMSKASSKLRSLYQPLITHTISKELTPKDMISPADINAIKPHLQHFAESLYDCIKLVYELNALRGYMSELNPKQVSRNLDVSSKIPSIQELLVERTDTDRRHYARTKTISSERETSILSRKGGSPLLKPAHSVSRSLVAL